MEDAREMVGVGEADEQRRLFDQHAGLLKLYSRMVHFQPQQILIGALVIIAAKQATDIFAVGAAFGGNLFKIVQAQEVSIDVAAAALIRGIGPRFGVFQRRSIGCDLQHQAFQEHGTETRISACGMQAALNQLVIKRRQAVRWKNRCRAAAVQTAGFQRRRCAAASEVHEILHQRRTRLGLDIVRNSGSVGEDMTGSERLGARPERQTALSAYYIFDAMIGKRIAADGIVRRAMLEATANNRQALPWRRIEIKKEAVGLSHLGREECRNSRRVPGRGGLRFHLEVKYLHVRHQYGAWGRSCRYPAAYSYLGRVQGATSDGSK